jgi:predicted NAD/FAD-binding protein
VVGGGISGLGAAWALARDRARFEVALWEKNDALGGNAVTVEMPQADGSRIPVDISVTAYVPTVYHHYVLLLERFGIAQVPTRFSYRVRHGADSYAHDADSPLKQELAHEIRRFRALLAALRRFHFLSESPSRWRASLNPFNYVSMGRLLDLCGFSADFRFKVLKPLFVNFVLASALFDMPASLFSRYLDFFDLEGSTPMVTWDQGTANLYRRMAAELPEVHLGRGVRTIARDSGGVTVHDLAGRAERFDAVVLACNADQALAMLERPSRLEAWLLSSVRYDTQLHHRAVVHSDPAVLGEPADTLATRSNYVEQHGGRPDNYAITYLMHNQQPWARRSDRPCLVTYTAGGPIDESTEIARRTFQHVVHDVFHVAVLLNAFQWIQGRRRTWHCGAHTAINSQEHGLISGLAAAHQLGADYPFDDPQARRWFNFWGRTMFGARFRPVSV